MKVKNKFYTQLQYFLKSTKIKTDLNYTYNYCEIQILLL